MALQFDLSSIPTGATVAVARLRLTVSASPGGASSATFSVYRVARSWDGQSASWANATSADRWTNVGGDYTGGGVATLRLSRPGPAVDEFDVTTAVQTFVTTPSSNNGLIILNTLGSMGRVWASSENPAAARRPQLVVIYDDGVGVAERPAPLRIHQPQRSVGASVYLLTGRQAAASAARAPSVTLIDPARRE